MDKLYFFLLWFSLWTIGLFSIMWGSLSVIIECRGDEICPKYVVEQQNEQHIYKGKEIRKHGLMPCECAVYWEYLFDFSGKFKPFNPTFFFVNNIHNEENITIEESIFPPHIGLHQLNSAKSKGILVIKQKDNNDNDNNNNNDIRIHILGQTLYSKDINALKDMFLITQMRKESKIYRWKVSHMSFKAILAGILTFILGCMVSLLAIGFVNVKRKDEEKEKEKEKNKKKKIDLKKD